MIEEWAINESRLASYFSISFSMGIYNVIFASQADQLSLVGCTRDTLVSGHDRQQSIRRIYTTPQMNDIKSKRELLRVQRFGLGRSGTT